MKPTILAALFLGATTAMAGAAGTGMTGAYGSHTGASAQGQLALNPGRSLDEQRGLQSMSTVDAHAGYRTGFGHSGTAADQGNLALNPGVALDGRRGVQSGAMASGRADHGTGFGAVGQVSGQGNLALNPGRALDEYRGVQSSAPASGLAGYPAGQIVLNPAGTARDDGRGMLSMTVRPDVQGRTLTFHDSGLDSRFAVEREIVERAQAVFGRGAVHETPSSLSEAINAQIVPGNRLPAGAPVRPVPAALGDLPTVAGGEWIVTGNHLVEVTPDQQIAWVVYNALR